MMKKKMIWRLIHQSNIFTWCWCTKRE